MNDDFARLREIVDDDPDLQAELLSYMERVPFCAALVRLAERQDLVISEAAIWSALEDGRSVWYATWT
jgi:hypothetical protein